MMGLLGSKLDSALKHHCCPEGGGWGCVAACPQELNEAYEPFKQADDTQIQLLWLFMVVLFMTQEV